jgi:enoyl-CoA hydratase/carnithine racemase
VTAVPGTIDVEVRGSAGWVTISNSARRNALSTSMMASLGDALLKLDADDSVRAVVVTGAGEEAFAAGADISEFEAHQISAEARQASDNAVAHLFDTLGAVRKPLVAMIRGYCLGAGLAVALGADLRIAARGSRFAIPAARLGIGYPVALTQALVHVTGPAHASDMLFTGRTLSDVEAERCGLVNRLVAGDGLERDVQTLLDSLAVNAPLSMRTAKLAIRSAARPELEDQAHELVVACRNSNDAREGQRAFLAKRAPVFEGR